MASEAYRADGGGPDMIRRAFPLIGSAAAASFMLGCGGESDSSKLQLSNEPSAIAWLYYSDNYERFVTLPALKQQIREERNRISDENFALFTEMSNKHKQIVANTVRMDGRSIWLSAECRYRNQYHLRTCDGTALTETQIEEIMREAMRRAIREKVIYYTRVIMLSDEELCPEGKEEEGEKKQHRQPVLEYA